MGKINEVLLANRNLLNINAYSRVDVTTLVQDGTEAWAVGRGPRARSYFDP